MALCTWISTSSPDYGVGANWSGGTVPTTGDDVVIPPGTNSILAGLDQSAEDIASFTVLAGYTGLIGTHDTPLYLDCPSVRINDRSDGRAKQYSGRINLRTYSGTAATVLVLEGGSTSTDVNLDLPPIRIRTDHASSTITARGGIVGVALGAGETATASRIEAVRGSGGGVSPTIRVGSGVTLTQGRCAGGEMIIACAMTTLNVMSGRVRTEGSGAITTVNCNGGEFIANSSGTIGTLNVNDMGIADFLRSSVNRTVTTTNLAAGGRLRADLNLNILTMTNRVAISGVVDLYAARAQV